MMDEYIPESLKAHLEQERKDFIRTAVKRIDDVLMALDNVPADYKATLLVDIEKFDQTYDRIWAYRDALEESL